MIVMATVYALSVACGTVYVYPHIHIRHARLAQMGPVASRNGNERPSTTVQKTAVCIRKRVLRRLLQSQSVDTVSMMCPQTPHKFAIRRPVQRGRARAERSRDRRCTACDARLDKRAVERLDAGRGLGCAGSGCDLALRRAEGVNY